jgi:calcineurin-like phosphoesterase family protein
VAETFLISDTHFGDLDSLAYTRDDGSLFRPFASVQQMDDLMIENWNKTIKPDDKVYHLGDVCIHRKDLKVLEKLNGKKCLIRGNHDIFKLKDYSKYFYDVRGCHCIDKFIFTHLPVHRDSLGDWKNIHGHIHWRRVQFHNFVDPFYYNVCVECNDFTPISFEEVKKRMMTQAQFPW